MYLLRNFFYLGLFILSLVIFGEDSSIMSLSQQEIFLAINLIILGIISFTITK